MPEPLLSRVPRAAMPPALRALAETAERDRGEAVFLDVAAHAPEMLDWYYDSFYARIFNNGRVGRRHKELLRLKLSTLHGCAFCNRGNTPAARAAGVTEAQIAHLADPDAPCFTPAERGILRLAEQMALQNMAGAMTPEIQSLLRTEFSEADIVEIGMTMAVLTGMAKFLFVFDLVSREANCPIGPGR